MIRVAIVEDDPAMRLLLADAIEQCDDLILADAAENISTASAIEAAGYDELLCDLGLPDGNGIKLIR